MTIDNCGKSTGWCRAGRIKDMERDRYQTQGNTWKWQRAGDWSIRRSHRDSSVGRIYEVRRQIKAEGDSVDSRQGTQGNILRRQPALCWNPSDFLEIRQLE